MRKYYQKMFVTTALFFTMNNLPAQVIDLSLEDALRYSAKGNRTLQLRWLESQKAAEAVKEAKSFLLPAVTAGGGYSVFGERPVIFFRNENANPKLADIKTGGRLAFEGSVYASYPLLHPGLKSQVRLSGISEQIRKEEVKETEEQLGYDVSRIYLTVLMTREQKNVLVQSLQRNERALKDSRSLFLQGKNLKTDTLSNYIAVQNLQASIAALDNKVEVLSTELKHLMGMQSGATLRFTGNLSAPVAMESLFESKPIASAFENRKDVRVHSLRIDQANEELQKEKAEFKPQLWAVAQYQVQSQADHLKVWDYRLPRTSFAGLRISIPIYTGGRQKYKAARNEMTVRQQELALAELKSSIQTELITLRANLQDAQNQLRIQEKNVEAAHINYTMMNDRYRYGLGNRLELTDAELALTRARLDQLQAVYSIRLIELSWKKATGSLRIN